MANPTSNFGWQMPTPVDLVTDLPADFEVFGQAVDSSLADLKGGTSGQILSKNSNTDMDFVWVTNDVGDITAVNAGTGISGGGTSGAVTITNSMATEITAKGDLIVGTGSATFDNLAAGANGRALVADSTAATGLAYSANAPLGGMTALNPGGTALTGAATITVSGLSNLSRITVLINGASSVNASSFFSIRLNGDTGNNYGYAGMFNNQGTLQSSSGVASASIPFARQATGVADVATGIVNFEGTFASGMVQYNLGSAVSGPFAECYNWSGYYISSAQITSISIISSTGNFDAGSIIIYGA
jgi:hypothetical protein